MDRRGKASATASMAALADAAAAREGADAAMRPPPPPAEGDNGPPVLNLQVAAAAVPVSPASSAAAGTARGGAAAAGGGGGSRPSCQAEGCRAELSERYNRRHKVCVPHSKTPVVLVAGIRQRFCQQCSRFHELSEFDDLKRSCRRRLMGHNERRRRGSAGPRGGGGGGGSGGGGSTSGSGSGGDGCRHADQDGRSHPGNPPMNNLQIR
ncbi:hypothetical protein ACP4OV_029527 [Aristida adscensionis]